MLYIDPMIISARGKNQNKVHKIKGTYKTVESKNQKEENKNDHALETRKTYKTFQQELREKAKQRNKQEAKKTQSRTDTITISQEGRKYIEEHDGR